MALIFILVCCGMRFQAEDGARIRFEMRLAEKEADSLLTEAAIQNSLEKIYLHKEALITNRDVVQAKAVTGSSDATFDIEIEFSQEASERIARATAEHVGKPLALLFNGNVISAPIVIGRISGKGAISGQFTREEAERIARWINGNDLRQKTEPDDIRNPLGFAPA
jgi:SecD/SecF fusion protein